MHRKMKSLFVIAAALLVSFSVFATDKSSEKKETASHAVNQVEKVDVLHLTGIVVDEQSNETLAGVSILVDGKKYYSDLDGKFAISDVTPGKYELTVEFISYEPVSMEVDLQKSEAVHIGLLQK